MIRMTQPTAVFSYLILTVVQLDAEGVYAAEEEDHDILAIMGEHHEEREGALPHANLPSELQTESANPEATNEIILTWVIR